MQLQDASDMSDPPPQTAPICLLSPSAFAWERSGVAGKTRSRVAEDPEDPEDGPAERLQIASIILSNQTAHPDGSDPVEL